MLYRYYATAVLDHVHRSKALEQWAQLGKGEDISLERALGSFDLFVLHDQHGDLLEAWHKLDIGVVAEANPVALDIRSIRRPTCPSSFRMSRSRSTIDSKEGPRCSRLPPRTQLDWSRIGIGLPRLTKQLHRDCLAGSGASLPASDFSCNILHTGKETRPRCTMLWNSQPRPRNGLSE
jgi:hypothetical protein